MYIPSELLVFITSPNFIALYLPVSEIGPEVVYNFNRDFFCVVIEKHVCTEFHLNWVFVSELHAHLCPYRNVWAEVGSCCLTRTIFVYQKRYLLIPCRYGYLSVRKALFLNSVRLLR